MVGVCAIVFWPLHSDVVECETAPVEPVWKAEVGEVSLMPECGTAGAVSCGSVVCAVLGAMPECDV